MKTAIAPRRLFDISADLEALEELLYESGGDITDEDVEEAIDAWFERLADERDQKLDNYAGLITELEARAEIRKAESKRLRDRASVDAKAAERLKDRLLYFFAKHDLKTVETTRYRLTRARAGGKAPVVITGDVPEDFQRVKIDVAPDKDKIREALESGEKLAFAALGDRSEYLKIS